MRKMKKKSNAVKIKACVEKGVKFLDREYGKSWLRNINAETLALQNGSACMLGQLEGTYETAKQLLHMNSVKAEQYGFTIAYCNNIAAQWALLTETWRNKINKLRKRKWPARYGGGGSV